MKALHLPVWSVRLAIVLGTALFVSWLAFFLDAKGVFEPGVTDCCAHGFDPAPYEQTPAKP